MSFEDAAQFWETVGEPMRVSELKVGDVFLLEDYRTEPRTTSLVQVVNRWRNDDGELQIAFQDAPVGAEPKFTMVAR